MLQGIYRVDRVAVVVRLRLSPFSEAIGTVSRINPDSVELNCRLEIILSPSEVKKWKRVLKNGSLVGILAMDDGTILVWEISSKRMRKEPVIRLQAGV